MNQPGGTPLIVGIRSGRGRRRTLTLDDGREFTFSDEAFARIPVREGSPAPAGVIEALDAADQRANAHEAALRLLSHRARSETEMRRRLAMRSIEPDAIEEEIGRLRQAGLLDDEQFAMAWAEERQRLAPRGRRLLRYELLSKGVAPGAVELATQDTDDREAAFALARQKARNASHTDYEAFLARVGGFLRRRGFDYGVALEAARTAWSETAADPPVD